MWNSKLNRRSFLGNLAAFVAFTRCINTKEAIAQAQPEQTNPSRRIVVSCPTGNVDEFRRLAAFCTDLGVTHLDISDLPKSRWQWIDQVDPWPNWGMLQASFFKIAPPEALHRYLPSDYSHHCQEILSERGEILRQHNLKASFSGAEPMWLPEPFYMDHPDWRGPRCQYPPRARRSYYSPCIDRPEVLDMYRHAVADICRLVPVEEFNFLANDSGSGICWHPGLYPGVNGPDFCKNRSMNERLDGWMAAIAGGAHDSGLTADVTIAGRSLTPSNKPRHCISIGPANYLYFSNTYPVVGIPQPCAFAEDLERACADQVADWRIEIDSVSNTVLLDMVREFRKQPAQGPLARFEILSRVSAKHAGPASSQPLLHAWECIGRAAADITAINEGGPILLLGSSNQRWLIRPLVPFPLELELEEKSYYRGFQMQAWSEEIASDLMALQGNYLVEGPASTWLAGRMFDLSINHLLEARKALKEAAGLAVASGRDEIAALDLRAYALILTIRNAKLTTQYQEFLDRLKETPISRHDPKWGRPLPEEGMKIAQADIENTKELIALLQSTTTMLFATAPTAAEEDVFLFNPALAKQLQKKIAITQRHLPEHIRL